MPRAQVNGIQLQYEKTGVGDPLLFLHGLMEQLPLFATQKHLPKPIAQRQRDERKSHKPHGLALSLRGMGAGAQGSLWGKLPYIDVPTLLLARAQHPLEQPEIFNQALLNFFQQSQQNSPKGAEEK